MWGQQAAHPNTGGDDNAVEGMHAMRDDHSATVRIILDPQHRRLLVDFHPLRLRQPGQQGNRATTLQVAPPPVVEADLVVPHGELWKASANLRRREHLCVGGASRLEVAPTLVHGTAGSETRQNGEAARPVIDRRAEACLPFPPLTGSPLNQLDIRVVGTGIRRPANRLGHVSRGSVRMGHRPLVEDGDRVPALTQRQRRRDAEDARTDNADLHRAHPLPARTRPALV